jgi:hypothetical protein
VLVEPLLRSPVSRGTLRIFALNRRIEMKGTLCHFVKAATVAGALVGSVASADCISYVCDQSHILAFYTRADGNAYIQISGNMSVLTCAPVSGLYIKLPANSPRFKEIYASLLAYQLTDRPVTVRMEDGVTDCTISYIYST